jgi:hypothetical protein
MIGKAVHLIVLDESGQGEKKGGEKRERGELATT